MNYRVIIETVRHLKLKQILYQVGNRICKAKYVYYSAPIHDTKGFDTEPIDRFRSLDRDVFTFLNKSHSFSDWNFVDYGTLFTYNQNYFDFINDGFVKKDEALGWIDKFIADIPKIKWGMDAYPIALRSINWMKFFCKHPDVATQSREDSLWSQLLLLQKKLEYHLLGNHLLEDSFALYMGGCYFQDRAMANKGYHLLMKQLAEQILPDGSHYEQSPMYHCILLDRLLDCINISAGKSVEAENLSRYAIKMLGHLGKICYRNGDIPLLNDAAYNIAPWPYQIFDYARRLGLQWKSIPMKECGYRKLDSDKMEAIVDIGNITASYQPGHSHADTLNYELRVNGKPYVVDTGTSTYDKNERRQFERSTIAHNCVSPGGKDCYEVWGGFRVGSRCHTEIVDDSYDSIIAWHDGFTRPCKRRFQMSRDAFIVEDRYEGNAVSYIHLAEGADVNRITIEGANKVNLKDYRYSTEYNVFHNGKVLEIHFEDHLKYTIR